MIESNLVEGRQDIPPEGLHDLVYRQSVTAACISWEDTVKTLNVLKEGVRARRAVRDFFTTSYNIINPFAVFLDNSVVLYKLFLQMGLCLS